MDRVDDGREKSADRPIIMGRPPKPRYVDGVQLVEHLHRDPKGRAGDLVSMFSGDALGAEIDAAREEGG